MAIYLKRRADGGVAAYGDEASLEAAGGNPDMVLTEARWNACGNDAHLEDGKLVLGASRARLAERVRAERDRRLETDVDPINAVRWNAMGEEERNRWTAYRKALLDLPEQAGFPWDGEPPAWPDKPE